MVDRADEVTLECNGVETVSEGISSDSGTREKKEKQVILKARIRKDSHKYRANDPQRSAGRIACAMQHDTKALQISQGPPHWSRTVKGGTTDCIGSSLTLPKSCLATL